MFNIEIYFTWICVKEKEIVSIRARKLNGFYRRHLEKSLKAALVQGVGAVESSVYKLISRTRATAFTRNTHLHTPCHEIARKILLALFLSERARFGTVMAFEMCVYTYTTLTVRVVNKLKSTRCIYSLFCFSWNQVVRDSLYSLGYEMVIWSEGKNENNNFEYCDDDYSIDKKE